MSRPRRKVFGPLFSSTLVVALIATVSTGIATVWPRIQEWSATRSLAAALRGDDARGREAAAAALAQKGDGSGLPYLREAARDARAEVRALACRYLPRVWPDPSAAVPVLLAAAGDDQEEVRLEAARGLGRVSGAVALIAWQSSGMPPGWTLGWRPESREALLRLLKDRSAAVRAAAAESLGEFHPDPMVASALVAATGDADRAVRLAVARALIFRWDRDRTAIRTLVAMVADPEPVPDRKAVLEILKWAGNEAWDQAAAALTELLSHADPLVLPDVINSLTALGDPARAALPALERLWTTKDTDLRAAVGQAIVAIEGRETPRGIAILLEMIADATIPTEQRQAALWTVMEVSPSALVKVTPSLVRQLSDAQSDVRVSAAELLSNIVRTVPAEIPDPMAGKSLPARREQ
ncbi:MAG TPA: HEAT repeat domain-containing protein [Isosphaeraceae bacterium]|nr:HEAT repeat domain-containing protein [Isosphaeraceae bacterium]